MGVEDHAEYAPKSSGGAEKDQVRRVGPPVCKSAGSAYDGSNPSAATPLKGPLTCGFSGRRAFLL
jgi:hypothetical protein